MFVIERWIMGHWVLLGARQDESEAVGVFNDLVERHSDWDIRLMKRVRERITVAYRPLLSVGSLEDS